MGGAGPECHAAVSEGQRSKTRSAIEAQTRGSGFWVHDHALSSRRTTKKVVPRDTQVGAARTELGAPTRDRFYGCGWVPGRKLR
jgi:hypothetical protein